MANIILFDVAEVNLDRQACWVPWVCQIKEGSSGNGGPGEEGTKGVQYRVRGTVFRSVPRRWNTVAIFTAWSIINSLNKICVWELTTNGLLSSGFGRRLLLPAAPKTVVAEPRGSVQYSLSGCDGWPGHAPASEEDRYDQGKEAVLAAVF